jgi:hypothetical protein
MLVRRLAFQSQRHTDDFQEQGNDSSAWIIAKNLSAGNGYVNIGPEEAGNSLKLDQSVGLDRRGSSLLPEQRGWLGWGFRATFPDWS